MKRSILILLLAAMAVACRPGGEQATSRGPDSTPAAPTPSAGVIDSILPMPEQLARFRRDVPATDSLRGGFPSREALVAAFVDAVERRDSLALTGFLLTRQEFAWLYFPNHAYSRPPYELAPGTFWQLTQANSLKGRRRLLDRLSGQKLGYSRFTCAPSRAVQAPVEEWRDCTLRLVVGGAPQELRLFGSIVGYGGRYKLVSFANDF